jgi:tyrosyl-tRNA synthetase
MTIQLLLKHDGTKMGKTAGGAIWLDPKKTTPYEFYQYWRNVDDADVLKFLRMTTFLPLEQIEEMDSWEGAQLNEAKAILAHELTNLVHGPEETEKAEAAAKALFAGGASAEIPTTVLHDDDFTDNEIGVIAVLVSAGLASSNGDARRAITQGGVKVNDTKITDVYAKLNKDELAKGETIIQKGKKNFKKLIVE